MVRTRVGYAGGAKENPTYHSLGDHTETIQIDYDPKQISYARLLEIFWQAHNPTQPAWSRQYMSIIFYHDEEQKRLAQEGIEALAGRKGKIHTEIRAAEKFYRAEDYHQKYYLRRVKDLLAEIEAYYPQAKGLVDSTAAARLNGYLGGYGNKAELDKNLDDLGLSAKSGRRLLDLARSRLR